MRAGLVLVVATACGGAQRGAAPDVAFVVPPPYEGEVVVMTLDATDHGRADRVSHREVRMKVRQVQADRVMHLEASFLASTENGEPDLIAGSTVIIRRGEEPRTVFESGAEVPMQQAAAAEGVVSDFLGRPPLPTLLASRRWPLHEPVTLAAREAALFETGEDGESDATTIVTIVSVADGVATIGIDRSDEATQFRGHGDIRFDVTRGRVLGEAWTWQGRRGDDTEPMHDFRGSLTTSFAFE